MDLSAPRSRVTLALAFSLVAQPMAPAAISPAEPNVRSFRGEECAGSHGSYFMEEYYDPNLVCQVELSGSDWSVVQTAIGGGVSMAVHR